MMNDIRKTLIGNDIKSFMNDLAIKMQSYQIALRLVDSKVEKGKSQIRQNPPHLHEVYFNDFDIEQAFNKYQQSHPTEIDKIKVALVDINESIDSNKLKEKFADFKLALEKAQENLELKIEMIVNTYEYGSVI